MRTLQLSPGPADAVPQVSTTNGGGSSRLVLVDVARVFAILFMIQGHSLDVLLAPEYRQNTTFDVWLFLRGLTAPVFFTLSGVSFMVSSMQYWERYTHTSWKLFRRFGRFALFIVLGYAMHLPAASLRDLQWADSGAWSAFYQVDVLQCLGVVLIALQGLVLLVGSPEKVARWSGIAAASVVVLTPLIWALDWLKLAPTPIAAYFSGQAGSFFPLFPWVAYPLFGVTLGYHLRHWSATPGKPVRLLLASGATLGAIGLLLISPLATIFPKIDFWKTSPCLFLIREGLVCLLLAGFAYLTAKVWVPKNAFRAIAQESLLIYFVHLCILYGSVWNPGMRQVLGAALPPVPTLAAILALVITMLLLGWSWNTYKRQKPLMSYVVRFALLVLAFYHPWL